MKLTIIVLLAFTAVADAQIRAHYINVGQADSILLEMRTAAILIDAGGEETGKGDNRDRDHLLSYLNQFFNDRTGLNRTLLAVIITHPHIDHTKNLMAVMQGFTVKNLIDGGNTTGSGIAALKAARNFSRTNHISYRAIRNDTIGNDGLQLFPALKNASDVELHLLAGARGCENANNDSLVVLLKYKEARYLFTGDAEVDSDGECEGEVPMILSRYHDSKLLAVDVYKVGHHGSYNGTDEEFMQAVTPKIAVISAGIYTQRGPGQFHAFQYGHPREVTVALLERLSIGSRPPVTVYSMTAAKKVNLNRRLDKAVYCTCWDGDVVVSTNIDGSAFNVETSGRH